MGSDEEHIKMLYKGVTFFATFGAVSAFSLFTRPAANRPSMTKMNAAVGLDSVYGVETYNTREMEHLIEEEMVSNDAEASALADRCMAEAER